MTMPQNHHDKLSLAQLGWRPFFQQQVSLEKWDYPAYRVCSQHRNRLELLGEAGELNLDLHPDMPAITVGDWLLLSQEGRFDQLLERNSLFRRKAAGTRVDEQLIAANVDTLFIVTSLNEDLNPSRIERYLSLANEAETEPVVVLSKADLCDDPVSMRGQVQALDPLLMVETVNCLDEGDASLLRSLANQVAVAIRTASSFEEVETALTEAQEDYLKQILLLSDDNDPVSTQELADRLEVQAGHAFGERSVGLGHGRSGKGHTPEGPAPPQHLDQHDRGRQGHPAAPAAGAKADDWIRSRADRLVPCLPASGEDRTELTRLLELVGA